MAKSQKVPMSIAKFVEKFGSKPENFSGIQIECLEGNEIKTVPVTEAEVLVPDFELLVTNFGQSKAVFITRAMGRSIRNDPKCAELQTLAPELVLKRVVLGEELRAQVLPLMEDLVELGLTAKQMTGPLSSLLDKVHAGADQLKGWFEQATAEFEAALAANQAVWAEIKDSQKQDKNCFKHGEDWQEQLEALPSYATFQVAMAEFLEQSGIKRDGPYLGAKPPFIKCRVGEPMVISVKRREYSYFIMPKYQAMVMAELLYETHLEWVRFMREKNPQFENRAQNLYDYLDMVMRPLVQVRAKLKRYEEEAREIASYSEDGFKSKALAGTFEFIDGNIVVKGRERRGGFKGKKDRRRDGWGARD